MQSHLNILYLLLLLSLSCSARPVPVPTKDDLCTPKQSAIALAGSNKNQQAKADSDLNEVPTFAAVKEIFNSNSGDRRYKCAICHSNFNRYEEASDPFIFNKIIASIENKTMPKEGELVQDNDLKILKAWENAGFPEKQIERKAPEKTQDQPNDQTKPSAPTKTTAEESSDSTNKLPNQSTSSFESCGTQRSK